MLPPAIFALMIFEAPPPPLPVPRLAAKAMPFAPSFPGRRHIKARSKLTPLTAVASGSRQAYRLLSTPYVLTGFVIFFLRGGAELRLRWPLPQHARALADSQSDPRPVFDRVFEHLTSLFKIVAGVNEAIDLAAVFGPIFDLVEVAMVRDERVICFLLGPISLVEPIRHGSLSVVLASLTVSRHAVSFKNPHDCAARRNVNFNTSWRLAATHVSLGWMGVRRLGCHLDLKPGRGDAQRAFYDARMQRSALPEVSHSAKFPSQPKCRYRRGRV
jgi:hypothetical protein